MGELTKPRPNPLGRESLVDLQPHRDLAYTDEKILPLAAELGSVPAIGAGQGERPGEQADLLAFVAELSAGQRRALLGMLSRGKVG